jgi:DNA-binding ferritin-like protein
MGGRRSFVSERAPRRGDEDELQQQLNDVLALAVVGDHVRWVVRGQGAAELAAWLTGAVADWRACADRLAHELAASGVAPDGRVRALAKDIPLNWVPAGWLSADEGRRLMLVRIATVARWGRHRYAQIGGDRAEVLGAVCSCLEGQLADSDESAA